MQINVNEIKSTNRTVPPEVRRGRFKRIRARLPNMHAMIAHIIFLSQPRFGREVELLSSIGVFEMRALLSGNWGSLNSEPHFGQNLLPKGAEASHLEQFCCDVIRLPFP